MAKRRSVRERLLDIAQAIEKIERYLADHNRAGLALKIFAFAAYLLGMLLLYWRDAGPNQCEGGRLRNLGSVSPPPIAQEYLGVNGRLYDNRAVQRRVRLLAAVLLAEGLGKRQPAGTYARHRQAVIS